MTRAAKKEQAVSAGNKTATASSGGTDFSKVLNAILMVVIAILLADKFGALQSK